MYLTCANSAQRPAWDKIIESLRNTTRLLMTSQRSLETSAIFRFAPILAKGWRDRGSFLDFFGSSSAGASCCVNSLMDNGGNECHCVIVRFRMQGKMT